MMMMMMMILRTPLSKLASVNKKLAWTIMNNVALSDSDVLNMDMILELLYFKKSIADLTLFSKEEIYFMIEYCCVLAGFFSPPFYHFIFLYSCTLYDFMLNK